MMMVADAKNSSTVMQAVTITNFIATRVRIPILGSANLSHPLSVVMEFLIAMMVVMKKTVTLIVTTAETSTIVSGACVQNDVTIILSAMIKLTS